MKKGIKITAAAALAVSALTPVAALAAETTLAPGYYSDTFTPVSEFAKMKPSEKKAFLKANLGKANFIFIDGENNVYDFLGSNGEKILNHTSEAELKKYATTVAAYETANKVEISSSGIAKEQEAAGELKVESVSAINAKQIQVKFSQAIDKASLITSGKLNAGDFEVTRVPAGSVADKNVDIDDAAASLSKDGKTLTLTADGTTYFDGDYAITLKEDTVYSADGKKVPAYSSTFKIADAVNPVVEEVTYSKSTGKITVEFSEPLKSQPSVVRLNGQPVTIDAFAAGDTEITFTNTAKAGTTATVYVAGSTDYKDNTQTPYNGSVKIPVSEDALKVETVKQVDSNVVRLTFDKELKSTLDETDVEAALTVIRNGVRHVAASNFAVTPVVGDAKSYDVTIDIAGAGGADYGIYSNGNTTQALTFFLAEGSLLDVFDNSNVELSQTITLTKDTTGPKVASTRLTNDKTKFVVTFDQEVIVSAGDISIRESGADTGALAGLTTVDPDNSNRIIVTPNASVLDGNGQIKSGNYTIRLAADAVTDIHTNSNLALTATIAVNPAAPKLTVLDFDNAAGVANTFEVEYDQAVTDSALALSNYTLDGAALPAGTDIYFKDADKEIVVIKLPEGSVNIGEVATGTKASLAVKNVKNASGVTVTPASGDVTIEDNTSAVLQSAKVVGDEITLTFSESLDATTATFANLGDILANFEIKSGNNTVVAGTGVATADLLTGDATKLVIKFTNTTDTFFDSTKTIQVKVLEDALEDANKFVVKEGKFVTATK